MPNRSAFSHKPSGPLAGVFFHPTQTKALWDKVWSEARKRDWWEEGVGCVGNRNGFFYFQVPGLTTGFAKLKIDVNAR